jgi:hypothetical protein
MRTMTIITTNNVTAAEINSAIILTNCEICAASAVCVDEAALAVSS